MSILVKFPLISLGAILVVSCGGSDSNSAREKQMEKVAAHHGIDADVTLDESGEATKVEIKRGGATIGQSLDLPSGFPDDITLPGDWNVIASSSPLPNSHSINALSSGSAEEIKSELEARLSEEGWSLVAADSLTPQMSRLNFEKDNRVANFNIIQNGDTRAVQLLTMPKP